jgi:putative tryptophan/tyrosine transport system substrate-binding protein
MNRRQFLSSFTAAVACPTALRAGTDARRIGVLMSGAAGDLESQARIAALAQALEQLGWSVGGKLKIEYRWGNGDADTTRRYAEELVALKPDVIVANSSAAVSPLLNASRTVPIVFTTVADPVAAGYVASLAHPGGNATGFTNFEYAIGGKWLELLKELAPGIRNVAVLRESAFAAGPGQFGAIQAAAAPLGIELRPVEVRDAEAIATDLTAFAQGANGGLIITGSPAASAYRALIIALAARHRLPAVYSSGFYAADGGLMAYGPDFVDQFRRAASYVDRILNGEKPGDLPVQTPTRYETVLNLKTAKAMGLPVSQSLLTRADVVIE